MSKIMNWLFRLIPHKCSFYHKETDHHGIDQSKRFCKLCEYEQWAYLKIVTNEVIWKESPNEFFKTLKNYKFA